MRISRLLPIFCPAVVLYFVAARAAGGEPSTAYTVQAVTQTGTVIPLGQEPDGTRTQFTLNGTITFAADA